MGGKTRQRNVSDSNEAQKAIEPLPSPHVDTNQEQTPQILSAALDKIRKLKAENDTLKQNHCHLQAQHAILRIKYNMMEEDHDRAIANEDTVEEENDILREVLEEMQNKYDWVKVERDDALHKQHLAEEEAFIFLTHLQICRNEIKLMHEYLQGAGVQ